MAPCPFENLGRTLNQGSTPLAIFEAQMVLFEVKWIGRQQRGTTTFQERYSSRLCGIFFQTLVQEYDIHLAIQSSPILCVLFEIKVVKCKLCESSSRFGGMKMLPRAACSSTHFALMMTLIYFRMEQSPGSVFFGDLQCYFDVIWFGKASNRSAAIVGKVEKVFILLGFDSPSSPISG